MLNWRTSLFGFLAFLPQLLNAIAPMVPAPWDKLILAVCGILAFYFAKDKDVTGAGRDARKVS